ncbi:MAG: hypothetical protein IPL47_13040 [Phyllobacteriaceae bacterium]|nr:hypothetical protein [Phyllobacteriaceae bacterium]
MNIGRTNIWVGLSVMAFFMAYGFLLIWLRDFAPGKEEWIAAYSTGKHFESRLAHVHGNLIALTNILFGYLMLKLPVSGPLAKPASWLALAGLMMPLGILGEVYLGLSPIFVLAGAASIVAATVLLALAIARPAAA